MDELAELRDFFRGREKANLCMVAVNILVFAVLELLGDTGDVTFMLNHGACYAPWVAEKGEYYRLFTCMFLHFGAQHLFNNMLCLLFLGDLLEKAAGTGRYLLIYLAGGLGSSVISVLWELRLSDAAVSAGASGAVFSVIGALVFLAVVHRRELPCLGRRRLYLMAALSVFQGFSAQGVDNAAHVGGFVLGFILAAVFVGRRTAKRLTDVYESITIDS